jgi:hypothetical protein
MIYRSVRAAIGQKRWVRAHAEAPAPFAAANRINCETGGSLYAVGLVKE